MPLCLLIFLGFTALAGTAASATPEADLTAEELAIRAQNLFARRQYTEAADAYRKFLADFGSSSAAAEAVRGMRYPLAMCLLQTRRYPEALAAIEEALAGQPPIDPAQSRDLSFWLAVCRMQTGDYPAARKTFEEFLAAAPSVRQPRRDPATVRLPEARLLLGTCLLLEGEPRQAAEYFSKINGSAAGEGGRARVLELHALLEAGEDAAAAELVVREFPHVGEIVQLITFQSLTLELGSRFLEQGDLRQAIRCLQRVWKADEILKHQRARLDDLKSRLEAAETDPHADPYVRFSSGQMIAKVKRELEKFGDPEAFDAALRARLAMAYQAMARYREAALILEALAEEMPSGPILESAGVNLVQCWSVLERWSRATASARDFLARHPRSPAAPKILYLQGIAEQQNREWGQAIGTFDALVARHPGSEFAPRARFLKAFCLLQSEQNAAAVAAFAAFAAEFPRHEMADDAAYWKGVAHAMAKEFSRCREAMGDYLKTFEQGRHRASAKFRMAYCSQQERDYPRSIRELRAFVREHPEADECPEARILLGDALLAEGHLEDGIAALKGVPEQASAYADAVFKIGKAYKLSERFEEMQELMAGFAARHSRHPRVAEALYWIGWAWRQKGESEKGRTTYWDAIERHGNDFTIRSVTDLFPALAKLYAESQADYLARLRTVRGEAERSGQSTLVLRCLWAEGLAIRKSDAEASRSLLAGAWKIVKPETSDPPVLADVADALLESGKEKEAAELYRELLRWNPRAPQRDRALARIGLIELGRGNRPEALKWFGRFESETEGSRLFGKVMLAKAQLRLGEGNFREAKETLDNLLASEYSSGQEKAEALYLIGEIHMNEGNPSLAIPYFQRIYVMHGRWRAWVAKAYFRSGEAFERLGDALSARRTYQELSESEDLSTFKETGKARDRLNALGGPVPLDLAAPAAG